MHAASVFCASLLGLSPLLSPARADEVVFATGDPYGGPIGVTGFDVHTGQSVAIRFSPSRDCTLTEVSLWLMANTQPGQEIAPTVTVSLREDAGLVGGMVSPPAASMVMWTCGVSGEPFAPARHTLACGEERTLVAGRQYWIVAESSCTLHRNPVWNWSGQGSGVVALRGSSGGWSAMQGVAVGVEVRGETCGSADFNGDGDFGTDQDIEAFFACLAGSCCAACGTSDFNRDGDFGTDQDIEAFFRVLSGAGC
jgi:hypothetical protein